MFGDFGGLGGLEEAVSFNEVAMRVTNPKYSYGIPDEVSMVAPMPTGLSNGGMSLPDRSLLEKTAHVTTGGKVITYGDVLLYGGLSYLAYMAFTRGMPQLSFGTPARSNPKRRQNKKRKRRSKRSRNPNCK
jgi:hypothetical protein